MALLAEFETRGCNGEFSAKRMLYTPARGSVMKSLLFRLLGAGTLAAVFSVGVFIISLQPSDAPFVYYYSWERGAFIVSRADSSDSHVPARFSVPHQLTHIQGPGWSPSGQWFAWNSYPLSGTNYDLNVYAVHREGGEPLTILDSPSQIRSVMWAPNAVSQVLLILKKCTGIHPKNGYF
jgi:hypothetical protein